MSNVKKAFVEIAELLNNNANKKVSTILPQLMELMTAKSGSGSDIGKTFLKDDEGNVTAVFCYYHKKWEPISEVEYGNKKGTSTGLNTMCKEGVSNWTKQQSRAKKAKEELLGKITSGELEVDQLADVQAEIEEARANVVPRTDGIGFETAEEVLEFLK